MSAPWQSVYRQIPSGAAGTRATLKVMRSLARAGSAHPTVIRAAQDAVRNVVERDDAASIAAILDDVRRRMRYTRDPLGTETVKAPWVVIDSSDLHGPEPMDCDDAATVASAMLGAVGIPTKFIVVAADARRPDDYSHVYLAALTSRNTWLPIDPIVRSYGVGQEIPASRVTRRGQYPVNAEGEKAMLGCERGCRIRGTGIGAAPDRPMTQDDWNRLTPAQRRAVLAASVGVPAFVSAAGATGVPVAATVAAQAGGERIFAGGEYARPGFFRKPDGSLDIMRVGAAAAVVAIGWFAFRKMRKR